MFKRLKNFTISVYQNYFEIAACLGASLIIILAIFMDYILGLQACPMCMMTRYLFGVISVIAFLGRSGRERVFGFWILFGQKLRSKAAFWGPAGVQNLIKIAFLGLDRRRVPRKMMSGMGVGKKT